MHDHLAQSDLKVMAKKIALNPFKPNGISHHNQLEHHFYSNFNRTFCKQFVETLIKHRILGGAASGLGLHYLLTSHKKDARLIWVNGLHIFLRGPIHIKFHMEHVLYETTLI